MELQIYDEIKRNVDTHKYISFDLFDTLIKRDCYQPIELFRILEEKIDSIYHITSNFANIRVQAEIEARKISHHEEVNLDEIYLQLHALYPSLQDLKTIKKWEQEYELNFCQWNPLIQEVYNYCIQKHKIVLIVTDIYLPKNLIEEMLNKLQIQYDFLFVSSEERKTKHSGNLFQTVLAKIGCEPQKILHIGDNRESDYAVPRKLGITAIKIPRDDKINLFIQKKSFKNHHGYANMCSFINNHSGYHNWNVVRRQSDLDYFFQAGYEVQGPLLYGFVQWLEKQLKKQKIDKVFFFARDGQLIQKAYNTLEGPIPNSYMFASRRALIVPTLWMQPDLHDVIHTITFLEMEKIPSILKRIGLQSEHYKNVFVKKQFSWTKEYNSRELFNDPGFKSIYDSYIKPDMIISSKNQYQNLVTYLNQINFKGKVAIVDIGWFGNMQRSLDKVVEKAQIPAKVQGFYLGLNPFSKVLSDDVAHGFLFDRNYNIELFRIKRTFNALFEILFTADHGTTLGYQEKNGKIAPVLDSWEYEKNELRSDYNKINAVQKGALEFVKDAVSVIWCNLISSTPQVSFMNWICLGFYPDQRCAKMFGGLHMLDDDLLCIAAPKYTSYGIHLKRMLKDLKKSLWQIGFLTILYGNKIPYGNLYYLLRDLIKGKISF